MKKFLIVFILAGFAAAIYSVRPLGFGHLKNKAPDRKISVSGGLHFSSYSNSELYTGLNNPSEAEAAYGKVYGAIISHHFFVEREIAQLLLSLKGQNYKTIVVVGPNHFNAGNSGALVSRLPYQTPWGVLEPNLEVIKNLEKAGLVGAEEQPFETEHSISVLTGFIKNIFPNAELVPIILKRNLKTDAVLPLGEWLGKNLPEDSLVLASVDFSHHQDLKATLAHDQNSIKILSDFDLKNIPNIEADSPQSLAVLLQYLKKKNISNFQYINTNSAYVGGNLDSQDITSYIFGYYSK